MAAMRAVKATCRGGTLEVLFEDEALGTTLDAVYHGIDRGVWRDADTTEVLGATLTRRISGAVPTVVWAEYGMGGEWEATAVPGNLSELWHFSYAV